VSTAPTPAAPAAPVLTNAGTAPATRRKLFVNLPVADLQRSITFFEALGFRFNPHFTDATATCMLVGDDAYVMLLTHERFQGFSERPMGDRARETNAMFALSVESREAVDAMVRRAIAATAMTSSSVMHCWVCRSGSTSAFTIRPSGPLP